MNHCQKQKALLFANGALDGVIHVDLEDSVVDLFRIQLGVDEDGHPVRQNEEVSLVVELQVVGEDQLLLILRHRAQSFRTQRLPGVPASNSIPVQLRQKENSGLLVEVAGSRLRFFAAISFKLEKLN